MPAILFGRTLQSLAKDFNPTCPQQTQCAVEAKHESGGNQDKPAVVKLEELTVECRGVFCLWMKMHNQTVELHSKSTLFTHYDMFANVYILKKNQFCQEVDHYTDLN